MEWMEEKVCLVPQESLHKHQSMCVGEGCILNPALKVGKMDH